jgi:hypothetical protein
MSKPTLIETVASGATVTVDGKSYGVVGNGKGGVNVVAEDGSWDTISYGTKVEVTG